jgi:hypothetical protein
VRGKTWAGAVRNGDFKKLFGRRLEDWWSYIHREAAIPGRDRVIVRWNFGTTDEPSYAWIAYQIKDADMKNVDLRLDAVYLPADKPGSGATTPDELVGEPFFAFL